MAKYVLLAFDKDADADEFVRNSNKYFSEMEYGSWSTEPGSDDDVFIPNVVVRGMWKKPTKFCSCIGGGKQSHGFVRGTKYGWWVCARCHKPTEAWSRGDVWYTALGTNLLPIAEDAPEYRGPLHKKHPGYEEGTK
jgi:hypothetical protein